MTVDDVVASVFDLEPEQIRGELTPDSLPNWDSLNHLKLVSAVEQAFGIKFSMKEVISIKSVSILRDLVRKHSEEDAIH